MPSPARARHTLSKIPAKIQKVKIGGVFWTKLELSLNKIHKRILNNPAQRFRPPPLRFRRAKQKNFLKHFLVARPQIFFN